MAAIGNVIEWGAAVAPLRGEAEAGDRCTVTEAAGGVLIGVVDGLGHGPDASHAARIATAILESHAHEPLVTLFERAHMRLRNTRGVAMSVATIHRRGGLAWLAVGNVDGVIARARPATLAKPESLMLHPGVVGYRLPRVRPSILGLTHGDLLCLATDGIHHDFIAELDSRAPPQRLADNILQRYATGNDDALVLAARFVADDG